MGLSLAAFQSNLYILGSLGTADCLVVLEENPLLYGYSLVERNQGALLDTNAQNKTPEFTLHQVTVLNENKAEGNKSVADPKKSSPPVMKAVSNNDESITVSIENAYSGDVYKLQYTVVNKGTIPVVINLGSILDIPHLKVENSLLPNEFLGPGERCSEELTITVSEKAEGEEEYSFSVELSYKQWNAD